MQNLLRHKKWIVFLTLLIALAIATPVLADYLGPNRVVTTTVPTCHWVKHRCAQDDDNDWHYSSVDSWLCSNESKPWEGCSQNAPRCSSANNGHTYCDRQEGTETKTVTYPEATIAGTLNCTLQNGWCSGGSTPELILSASEPVSGKVILLIEGNLNGESFACPGGETSCTIPLSEGTNDFNYWALSSWGDSSRMGSTLAKVDTVPPEVSLSVTGSAGHNDWYKSAVQVAATAQDATSAVATVEVAVDGGGYQAYTNGTVISFDTEAQHTLQFRSVDNAGNLFETGVQNFFVDTTPPTVKLRGAWQLGQNVPYEVSDEGSGLRALRIVIEDEDEKYAKVAWNEEVSGNHYSQDIDWNGQFKDKTVAPPGTYLVWLKASDQAGNERFELGKVIVPGPGDNGGMSGLPTEATEAPDTAAAVPPIPPAELAEPETATSGSGEVADAMTHTTTRTVLLTSGLAGAASSATTSAGILWGAAAAGVIGAATAYALEEARKRKEAEEAQAAQARAQVSHAGQHLTKEEKREQKAQQAEAHDQKVKERKERQEWSNPAQEKAKLKWEQERDAAYAQVVYQQWVKEQQEKAAQAALEQERREALANASQEKRIENRIDAQDQANWEKYQAEQQAARNAQMLASLPGYFQSEKQSPPVTTPVVDDNDPWWKKLLKKADNFVEETKQKVKDTVGNAVTTVQNKVEEIKTDVKQKWDTTKTNVQNWIKGLAIGSTTVPQESSTVKPEESKDIATGSKTAGQGIIILIIILIVVVLAIVGVVKVVRKTMYDHQVDLYRCNRNIANVPTLAQCFDDHGFMMYGPNEKIDRQEFVGLLDDVYQDINRTSRKPGDWERADYDTPFFDGNSSNPFASEADKNRYPNNPVCVPVNNNGDFRCGDRQSSVNYFAQGMYSAAAGETLEDGKGRVDQWKNDVHGETPAPGDYFWFEYGYNYYIQRKQCEESQSQLPTPNYDLCK